MNINEIYNKLLYIGLECEITQFGIVGGIIKTCENGQNIYHEPFSIIEEYDGQYSLLFPETDKYFEGSLKEIFNLIKINYNIDK